MALVGAACLRAYRGLRAASAPSHIVRSTSLMLWTATSHFAERQLMGFLGLTPSESSSGSRRRQGAITKTGNAFARRALVEAAWQYRFPARVGTTIARRQGECSETARAIAWKAQV